MYEVGFARCKTIYIYFNKKHLYGCFYLYIYEIFIADHNLKMVHFKIMKLILVVFGCRKPHYHFLKTK